MNSCQLQSEADASKDGQIWPHIRRPYPAGARYENLVGFRPGPDMISGAILSYMDTCRPVLTFKGHWCHLVTLCHSSSARVLQIKNVG